MKRIRESRKDTTQCWLDRDKRYCFKTVNPFSANPRRGAGVARPSPPIQRSIVDQFLLPVDHLVAAPVPRRESVAVRRVRVVVAGRRLISRWVPADRTEEEAGDWTEKGRKEKR